MSKQWLFMSLLCIAVSVAQAQITKPEKNSRGYLRLGFSSFGDELNSDLSNFSVNNGGAVSGDASMRDNVLEGRYGAQRGYVLEFGRQYYFTKRSLLPVIDARLGLDWTQLSLTYNELNFSPIVERDVAAGYMVSEDQSAAASIATMIGPVFSIRPIGKLVVDARVQLAAVYYANLTNYSAYNEATEDERYFSFFPDLEEGEDEGIGALTQVASLAFKPNFGLTARYGAIGLALDYAPGSVKSDYMSDEGDGEAKFAHNVFQIKLSLTL